ncbi:enoyl-CoA hydratase/carnithine racemase [Stella humosa]|uniref:Enoyl-CoA hydratase/carnithine racemase n=1 Tax=Stella humosa TaxID=94 RepID=A0A3N1LX08_9PROT|nr:enoyl-CoA hydratase-related protein [Stella humosa]ROP99723.1 enoyl-CoA hydratase/carnithine racemase [Stella humosa]BBK31050.1 crotonase [Stella humosa]
MPPEADASTEAVLYESRDRVAIITINNPAKANSINADVALGLAAAWRRFNASDDRVAVVTGAGEKAFSAGADLDAPPELRRFMPGVGIKVEKPIIAAVSGWCVGGSVVLVQMCDLCIASETARFSYPEAKLGFTGGLISSLATRIPHKVAMEFILMGEPMTAQRAYEVGFVNKVVPAGQHLAEAEAWARKLAGMAPLVLTTLKRFVGEALPRGPSEQAGRALADIEAVWGSDDYREGLAAFKAKRPPDYNGR